MIFYIIGAIALIYLTSKKNVSGSYTPKPIYEKLPIVNNVSDKYVPLYGNIIQQKVISAPNDLTPQRTRVVPVDDDDYSGILPNYSDRPEIEIPQPVNIGTPQRTRVVTDPIYNPQPVNIGTPQRTRVVTDPIYNPQPVNIGTPQRTRVVTEPSYFPTPINTDPRKVISDYHRKYPNERNVLNKYEPVNFTDELFRHPYKKKDLYTDTIPNVELFL